MVPFSTDEHQITGFFCGIQLLSQLFKPLNRNLRRQNNSCAGCFQQLWQLACNLFAQLELLLCHSRLPDKGVPIGIGFDFRAVNKYRRFLKGNFPAIHQQLHHLIQQILHRVG